MQRFNHSSSAAGKMISKIFLFRGVIFAFLILTHVALEISEMSMEDNNTKRSSRFYEKNMAVSSNIPQSERNCLFELFNLTRGDKWLWKNIAGKVHWNFTDPNVDPCSQQWEGITCTPVATDSDIIHVSQIRLGSYNLHGSLSDAMFSFTNLTYFVVSNNSIVGTIPSAIGNMLTLTYLDLSLNYLHGTIPDSIYDLKLLNTLMFNHNNLTGTISDKIINLSQLSLLQASTNKLTGTLPSAIGSLRNLYSLQVNTNLLHGTVPAAIFTLPELSYFIAYENDFSGEFPKTVSTAPKLKYLKADTNKFFGHLPSSLPLTVLKVSLYSNYFSGSLPVAYSENSVLTDFTVRNNNLDGSIPVEFCKLRNLLNFNLEYNSLTGPLPNCLAGMVSLRDIYFRNNLLEGTIPEAIGLMTNFDTISLRDNYVTGAIPPSLLTLPLLGILYLSNNLLSSTLPVELSHMHDILDLQLDGNKLSGTLPPLSVSDDIETFFVNRNNFHGSLQGVFNSSMQINLINVDVSNNQFTGDFPAELFRISQIQSVAAVSNCFNTGSLSEEVCEATELVTLALDGMMSSSACQHRLFPEYTGMENYWLSRNIDGGLPRCLFELPNLVVLHLSGNSIEGTIPSDVPVSPKLVDLSLSNNNFKGSIPATIQYAKWLNLDLSFNKLSGVLLPGFSTFSPVSRLNLEVCRFSGRIPASLRDTKNISVLNANLFTCDPNRDDLPLYDSHAGDYECGSNTLAFAMYAWVCIIGGLFLIGVLIRICCASSYIEQMSFIVSEWLNIFSRNRFSSGERTLELSHHFADFGSFCRQFRHAAVMFAIIVAPIMFVVNYLISNAYNTYTFEYAWTVSTVFISGVIPAVVLLLVFVILAFVVYFILSVSFRKRIQLEHERSVSISSPKIGKDYSQYGLMILVIIVNIFTIIGTNIAFVYVVLNYNSSIVEVFQLAVAICKVAWNDLIVRLLLRLIKKFHLITVSAADQGPKVYSEQYSVEVALFVVLFNNLAAPFIVVAAMNSHCFNDMFREPPAVHVSYSYAVCNRYNYTPEGRAYCIERSFGSDIKSTSYIPPFTYSYQCSSVFITTYTTVYVFMFAITAFVAPLRGYAYLRLFDKYVSSKSVGSIVWTILTPNILKPSTFHWSSIDLLRRSDMTWLKDIYQIFVSDRVFSCDLYIVQLIGIVATLLTFGVIFPPIIVIGCVAIFTMTYTTQLSIGRYVVNLGLIRPHPDKADDIKADSPADALLLIPPLGREIANAKEIFLNSVWIVIPFVIVFYSFLLFDILGDEVGWKQAVWMPTAIIAVSILLWIVRYLYMTSGGGYLRNYKFHRGSYTGIQFNESEVENAREWDLRNPMLD